MLDQGMWDAMAVQVKAVLTPEPVTYTHPANPWDQAPIYPGLEAVVQAMRESPMPALGLVPQDRIPVLRGDQEISIATADVPWEPSIYGEITRADGTRWRVKDWHD